MNLAFCLFKYFPYGGLQRDFLRIAKACQARGHHIDVYTMRWEGMRDPTLPVNILPVKGWQNHTRSKHFANQLQTILINKPYDLVVGFNKMPGLDLYYAADTCFQAKARKKHGVWYRCLPRYRHLVEFEKAVFSKDSQTKILLLSSMQQTEFIEYYHTPLARFHLLPPGISEDRIAPPDADVIRKNVRRTFSIADDDFLLLMVGSGFKTKGLDRILLGLADLPHSLRQKTKLFIIGQDHPKIFQRQAEKLGLLSRITFLGGRDDVPRFLLAADLLLHPAYNENTGTVLLEALVSGLPVLTTDICGYAHYIQDAKAGIVLPSPFQQQQFNKTLAEMLLLSQQRATWRQQALEFSKQADIYDLPKHAVQVIESMGHLS